MSDWQEIWRNQLRSGLEQLDLAVSQQQQQKLLDYLALLMKWNQTYNLTAIRDPDEMVVRQLLDSLSILPLVQGKRILDVGTGAGLPGIPLAICMPQAEFTLIDSNGKKTRFVQQAKLELGLDNLEVHQSRIERFEAAEGFTTITTRAFAALPKIVELTARLLADKGIILAMKGSAPGDEVELVRAGGNLVQISRLPAALGGERHAIIVQAAE
jgi:16S rRNA (guanine527-N7)-methyltransferase